MRLCIKAKAGYIYIILRICLFEIVAIFLSEAGQTFSNLYTRLQLLEGRSEALSLEVYTISDRRCDNRLELYRWKYREEQGKRYYVTKSKAHNSKKWIILFRFRDIDDFYYANEEGDDVINGFTETVKC